MHEKLKSQLTELYVSQAEELLNLVELSGITSIEQLQKIVILLELTRSIMTKSTRWNFVKQYVELDENIDSGMLEMLYVVHNQFMIKAPTSSVAFVFRMTNGHNYTVGRCVARTADGRGNSDENYRGIFRDGAGNNLYSKDTVFPTREQFDVFLDDLDRVSSDMLSSLVTITEETLNDWF